MYHHIQLFTGYMNYVFYKSISQNNFQIGVAVKIMDSRTICDQRMVKFMKQTADKNKITWQPEILTGGGTDTMGIQQFTAGGSIAGAISVPTRHIHQVIETCHKNDVEGAVDLLVNCVQEIGDFDWSL